VTWDWWCGQKSSFSSQEMAFLLDEEKTWIQRDFGLDRKILKGISKLGFLYPTMVQAKCLPIVLQGKDVLVRARTGSGKTYAFVIPILHKILTMKEVNGSSSGSSGGNGNGGGSEINSRPSIKTIILAPTKELCKQIETHTTALLYYCRDHITVCSLSDDSSSVQHYHLQAKPDIVITTPARLVNALQNGLVNLSSVHTLVVDEADLVLSFGYADDVQAILSKMPKIYQGLLFSATLSPELEKFKKVVLHSPAILKLHETTQSGHLLQMYLRSTEADKFLILYVFIKLGLLQVTCAGTTSRLRSTHHFLSLSLSLSLSPLCAG
jgi:ATP-dependent RNA helicase DDX56/DBP9